MLMLNEISQTGDTAVVIATHNHSYPRRYRDGYCAANANN